MSEAKLAKARRLCADSEHGRYPLSKWLVGNWLFNWAWWYADPESGFTMAYWEAGPVAASLALDGMPARRPRKRKP